MCELITNKKQKFISNLNKFLLFNKKIKKNLHVLKLMQT